MAQHDYVIANGTGAAVRSDLNNGLAAIVSQNSGATAPATTYAYMTWADTTAGVMKMRNGANNAWITLYQLDGEWSTIAFENGSAAAPSIYFKDSGTDTGVYSPGTDQVAITTGGTQRLAADTAAVTSTLPVVHPLGAVGTPSITFTGDLNTGIYSPGADQLAISTNGVARLTTSTTAVSSSLAIDVPLGAVGTPSLTFTGDLNTGLFSPGADTVALVTGGTNRLHITSAGLVGIGTTSPGRLLSVQGIIGAYNSSGANDSQLLVYNNGTSSVINSTYGTTGGYTPLVFDVGGSERARIDTSGRLLVGTSSGTGGREKLQVLGNANEATTGAGEITLARASFPADSDPIGKISFTGPSNQVFATIESVANGATGTNDHPGLLKFSTTADGASSPTERMRIQADGVVKVAGDSWTLGRTYIGNSGASGSGIGTSSNGANSTTLYIGNAAIQVSSDARLKENIEDTSLDALDAISQIRVKDFTWNDPTDTSSNNRNARGKWTGLIAQELVGVLPFVVNAPRKEADGSIDHESQSTWTLDQSQLCPVLIKAVQQQQEIIASLEARIAALETP
jgi:hypothetical protein